MGWIVRARGVWVKFNWKKGMTNVEIQMTKEIQNPNDEGRLRAKKIVLDILYSLRHLDFDIPSSFQFRHSSFHHPRTAQLAQPAIPVGLDPFRPTRYRSCCLTPMSVNAWMRIGSRSI